MTRALSSRRFSRERVLRERGPLSAALFSARRTLSRMSLVDVAAVLLVWGNILGLIAYPVFAGHAPTGKNLPAQAVASQLAEHK